MFDGEMVKGNFAFEKNFGLRNFWSKTQLHLENFWSKTKLNLENFWSKTKLDLENFHWNFFLAKCHVWWGNGEKKFCLWKKIVLQKSLVQDKVGLRKFWLKFFFSTKPWNVMFDGEIVKKKFPLKKNLYLENFLVQDKVGLRKFLVQDKFGLFEKNFGLRKFLVQDTTALRKFLVQDKFGLRKFSLKFFVSKMSCLMGKWWKEILPLKKNCTSKIIGPRQIWTFWKKFWT